MHRAVLPGMSVDQLETPVLVIDLDAMERNLATMMDILEGSNIRLRPHLKTAKSPALAAMMVRAGATGICCAKLSEAEVMANAGLTDILLTSEVAGAGKVERLVALAARVPGFMAVVDSSVVVDDIARQAAARGLMVNLLIELDVHTGRSGVVEPSDVLQLANQIESLEGVQLVGIHAYAGHAQVCQLEDRIARNGPAMDRLEETVELLAEHNHQLSILSGGGSGSVRLDVERGLLNEIQAGSFLLMDTAYRDAGVEFENALTCRATVISRPAADRAVCDAGQKTLSKDAGQPEVTGRPGVTYNRGSDEHGTLDVDPSLLENELRVGDGIDILPSHVCTTINLHDEMVGVRNGIVESVFTVDSRGCVW